MIRPSFSTRCTRCEPMTRVHRGGSLAEVGHLKSLLEEAGIRCMIKNELLSAALGEIPFLECLPELWVLADEQARHAEALIAESMVTARAEPVGGPAWRCGICGASNEPQFAACWRCGACDAVF
jgi:Putative prokaryotic signal transducing protein